VIVAFSGGADSVLAAERAIGLNKSVSLWYLHHYPTATEPERENVFAATLARHPGLRMIRDQVDVSLLVKRLGYSWEHAASAIRRKRLNRFNTAVVTGHNYSDYLETLELRRRRKLPEAAMPPLAEHDLYTGFWRPLWQMTREQVRAECDSQGFVYFDDPANSDMKMTRNQIRVQLCAK